MHGHCILYKVIVHRLPRLFVYRSHWLETNWYIFVLSNLVLSYDPPFNVSECKILMVTNNTTPYHLYVWIHVKYWKALSCTCHCWPARFWSVDPNFWIWLVAGKWWTVWQHPRLEYVQLRRLFLLSPAYSGKIPTAEFYMRTPFYRAYRECS